MMDAVIVREADELRARLLHHPKKIEHLRRLLGWQRPQRRKLFRKGFLVEGDDVTDALEL